MPTDVTTWNLIIGFISATLILPLIQRPDMALKWRSLITVVWSIICGLVTVWLAGTWDAANIVQSIGLVFVSAIAFYKGFAQPTGIAPAIENATSPGAARKQPLDDPPG